MNLTPTKYAHTLIKEHTKEKTKGKNAKSSTYDLKNNY